MLTVIIATQMLFAIMASIYFYLQIKQQKSNKVNIKLESRGEIEKLKKMRDISLTQPLSEKTRPTTFDDVVGQENGIKALRAALCSPNPQHVIIYGPPGVGKTAVARLILNEAKANSLSPFRADAKFVEIDATTLHFDERSIADPLIGSVHDSIYQGAGDFGAAGIPQIKPGAVTKAHGGILFLDEIGELHPTQINKLLKVLEDRVVYLSSSYYAAEDKNIPSHIHDIFKNGLPADFRLIGATTRSPEDIPPAIRSRCTEIFFNQLNPSQIKQIACNATFKAGFTISEQLPTILSDYSTNGRDAVNIVQTAASLATMENRKNIDIKDIEWVLESGKYTKRLSKKVSQVSRVGCVNGLAVFGMAQGSIVEIEAIAYNATESGKGTLTVTGIIEEEELNSRSGKAKRVSCARGSIENAFTLLNTLYGICPTNYIIHINFPGGLPIDGPSAGAAIFAALYSAITKIEIDSAIAITGEITLNGNIHPVGGVHAKIEAAIEAGAKKVFIPKENYQQAFANYTINIMPVSTIKELIETIL